MTTDARKRKLDPWLAKYLPTEQKPSPVDLLRQEEAKVPAPITIPEVPPPVEPPSFEEAVSHLEWAKQGHIPVEGIEIDEWNQQWLDNYDFVLNVLGSIKKGKPSVSDIKEAIGILEFSISLDQPPQGWAKWKEEREVAGEVFGGDVRFIHWEMVEGYRKIIALLNKELARVQELIPTTTPPIPGEEPTQEEIQRAFEEVWPGEDIGQLLSEFEAAPELFYQGIQGVGRVPETEVLVKAMFPEITPLQMDVVFMSDEDSGQWLWTFKDVPFESKATLMREIFPGITDEEITQMFEPQPIKLEEPAFPLEWETEGMTPEFRKTLEEQWAAGPPQGRQTAWSPELEAAWYAQRKTPPEMALEGIHKYLVRPWRFTLMVAGFGFGEMIGGVGEERAGQILEEARREEGPGVLFSEEIDRAWATYFEERNAPAWLGIIADIANPGWFAIPSARWAKLMLARGIARGGAVGVAAETARAALAPAIVGLSDIEVAVGAGLKYGVGLPAKFITIDLPKWATREAFEVAFDAGLDKWLVRQGIRGDKANRVIAYFLRKNSNWLYRKAQDNLIKNMAERRGVKDVATAAAEDTMREAEPLLLQAARESEAATVTARMPEGVTVRAELAAEREPLIGKKFGFGSAGEFEVIRVEGDTAILRGERGNEITASVATLTERLAEEPTIPRPVPGMPEAGIQAGMEGLAKEKVVTPKGPEEVQATLEAYAKKLEWEEAAIGERAQEVIEAQPEEIEKVFRVIKPDEQKLTQAFNVMGRENRVAFRRGLEQDLAEIEEMGSEAWEAEGIRAFLATDKVATYKGTMGKRTVGLTTLLKHGQWPDSLTQKEAQVVLMGRDIKDAVLTPEGRVRWEYVLDELADHFGMTEQQLIDHVEYIRKMKVAAEDATALSNMAKERYDSIQEMLRILDKVEGEVEVKAVGATVTEELNELYGQIQKDITALEKYAKSGAAVGEELTFVNRSLKDLKAELAGLSKSMKEFEGKLAVTDRQKALRQTTMAWAKLKGLPEKQYHDIFAKTTGHRQLHLMSESQLEKTLEAIKKARPKTIGHKNVITQKTEGKIASLKESLMAEKSLTEKSYQRLLNVLRLRTDKYENAHRFITESEAKTLIRAMNDEAPLVAWDVKVEESLARNPKIKAEWDNINAKMGKGVEIAGEPVRVGRGNELRSMRYYTMLLQKKMDAPIYDIWQKINMVHLVISQKQQQLINKLQNSIGDESFRTISRDDAALKRVENYIASKHKMGPKKPVDITTQEIKLADEFEQQLFEFRNDVRFARFREAYAGHSGDVGRIADDIPDAPKDALRKAVDIYEGKGEKGLRAFLDTQEWGVIRSGYNPLAIVKPKLFLQRPKPTTFSKGHIQTREGTEYVQEERNIIDRYRSYQKQLMGLTDLAPLIRAFDRVFTESGGKLADPKHVGSVLSRGLNEMKGYHEEGGFLVYMMERMYGQVAATVFWRPDLSLRNKFQNWAFNPDFIRGYFAHPENKFMSPERRLWFEIFVTQNRGIIQDYLLRYHKPLPGFGRITRLANRTSLFPWSDKSNRAEAFMVRMNRVDRALVQYRKDGNVENLIRDSGLLDLEARQKQEALELLAMDTVDYGVPGMPAVTGEEAFARYNAQQLTNNVHFLYDRAQRSPAEMGAAGRTLGNIMTFQRSWGERIALQTAKAFNPESKSSMNERIYAARIVVGIIVAGWLFGEAYKRITGKRKNPYNPFNILEYSPGGLLYGAAEDASNLAYLILESIQGDKAAIGKLPGGLTQAAELLLPFYRNLVQVAETATGLKNIDRMALRKVRELIDKEYETRGGQYEIERNLIEALQHVFFGGEAAPESTKDKIKAYERQLGEIDEDWADLPYTIEEPDIYDMKNLNTDFGRLLEAGDEGYTDKGKAFLEKEESEAVFKTFPNVPLHQINADSKEGDTFEQYYDQWQRVKAGKATLEDYGKAYLGNFSRRTLDLLREYHSLEGEEQEDFLEEHPELEIDPRDQWLRDNPKQNAQLALWGQAKPMSLEAYDLMAKMAKELDIPDNAIPEYMPRNIFELDLQYQEVPLGNARLIFRHENPEYEKYLVEEKGYTPVGDRWKGAGGGGSGTYPVPPRSTTGGYTESHIQERPPIQQAAMATSQFLQPTRKEPPPPPPRGPQGLPTPTPAPPEEEMIRPWWEGSPFFGEHEGAFTWDDAAGELMRRYGVSLGLAGGMKSAAMRPGATWQGHTIDTPEKLVLLYDQVRHEFTDEEIRDQLVTPVLPKEEYHAKQAEEQWSQQKAKLIEYAQGNDLLQSLGIPLDVTPETLTEKDATRLATAKSAIEAIDEPIVVSSEVYRRLGPAVRERVIKAPKKMSTWQAVERLLTEVVDSALKRAIGTISPTLVPKKGKRLSTDEVHTFLRKDAISELKYNHLTYNCFNFAMQLSEAAQKEGLDLRPAFVPGGIKESRQVTVLGRPSWFPEPQATLHWMLWFRDTEGNIVYIEPRADAMLTESGIRKVRKPWFILRL